MVEDWISQIIRTRKLEKNNNCYFVLYCALVSPASKKEVGTRSKRRGGE